MFIRARLPWKGTTCVSRFAQRRYSCICLTIRRCYVLEKYLVIKADDSFTHGEQHQAGHIVDLQALHDL